MLLSEFLSYFDFGFEVVNGHIRLVDLQGAYYGNIDRERFSLNEAGLQDLVSRMNVYINDYVFEDLKELLSSADVENIDVMTLAEMTAKAKEIGLAYDYSIVSAVLHPDTIEIDLDKVIDSLSVGQIFDELDTNKTIVLDKKHEPDIWQFKVYDSEGSYLYDTSRYQVLLAKDILAANIISCTHERALRVEPGSVLVFNGVLSATLENNDKLFNRFNEYADNVRGEVTYVCLNYNSLKDEMSFKVRFENSSNDSISNSRTQLIIPTEPDEKEALLTELRAIDPISFDRAAKPSLSFVISAAEQSKGYTSPGLNFDAKSNDLSEKISVLSKMTTAVRALQAAWAQCAESFADIRIDCNDYIVDNYPFGKSFDEIDVDAWCDSVIKNISKEKERKIAEREGLQL